jgi:hypothetical protein
MWPRAFWPRSYFPASFWAKQNGPDFDRDVCNPTILELAPLEVRTVADVSPILTLGLFGSRAILETPAIARSVQSLNPEHTIGECV